MDVSMAVQVRRRKACLDHAIDLRLALAGNIRRIQKPERSPSDKQRQRVELAGIASSQRGRRGERPPRGEIQVKAE